MHSISLFSVYPYSWAAIGASIFCGAIVGLERQFRGKPVGIRTPSLIVLGTYIFISTSMLIAAKITEPSRIIGQVVTGIGFIGAGVMLAKEGVVVGVTSAVIDIFVAMKLSVVVVAILYGVDILEDRSTKFTRGVHSKYSNWRKKG